MDVRAAQNYLWGRLYELASTGVEGFEGFPGCGAAGSHKPTISVSQVGTPRR